MKASHFLMGLLGAASCCLSATLSLGAVRTIHDAVDAVTPTSGTQVARQAEIASMRNNAAAFRWYMLNCAGCHRADGRGVPRHGVPSFVGSAGMFTWISAGRQYLIRVPGSASSHLNDKELAEVLNWIVATYSPKQLPPDFRPFSGSEVAAVRYRHYENVVDARHRIDTELAPLGLKPSLYLYGVDGRDASRQSRH